MLAIGEKFTLTEDAISNYGEEYRDKVFTVTHVSTSTDTHPGYDDALEGMPLYDAEGLNFSVYQYEIEEY